jgi:hypothetical protein
MRAGRLVVTTAITGADVVIGIFAIVGVVEIAGDFDDALTWTQRSFFPTLEHLTFTVLPLFLAVAVVPAFLQD